MVDPSKKLAEFDPDADFTAPKNMRFAGRAYLAGQTLDKEGVDPRKLKQLYQSRTIDMAVPDASGEGEEGEDGQDDVLTETELARVEQLIGDNDRKGLDQIATDLGITEPGKLGNKGAVADAIVRAERAAGGTTGGWEVGNKALLGEGAGEHAGKVATIVSIKEGVAAVQVEGEGEAIEGIAIGDLSAVPDASGE